MKAARWAWRSGRRLFPLPLVVTAVGLAVALAWPQTAEAGQQCGGASWYGNEHHGRTTASGERFDQNAMTAAHRSLPFGTMVTVTLGDRSVRVRINDRGPFIAGRIIDLSRAAAERLGMVQRGVAPVCLQWE